MEGTCKAYAIKDDQLASQVSQLKGRLEGCIRAERTAFNSGDQLNSDNDYFKPDEEDVEKDLNMTPNKSKLFYLEQQLVHLYKKLEKAFKAKNTVETLENMGARQAILHSMEAILTLGVGLGGQQEAAEAESDDLNETYKNFINQNYHLKLDYAPSLSFDQLTHLIAEINSHPKYKPLATKFGSKVEDEVKRAKEVLNLRSLPLNCYRSQVALLISFIETQHGQT